jgi:NAD(P)-dependent dehydrogenase (short-subunit alcohol dehydrogenase family)
MKPVVIVAGVGPGIGTSIARAFGAEGFAIALLASDSARLAKRHAEITAAGITAAPFIVDLADAAATRNAVAQIRTWAGGDPSSLVYNAFALQQGSADQLDLAETQRAIESQLYRGDATHNSRGPSDARVRNRFASVHRRRRGAASVRGSVESVRWQGGVAHVGPRVSRGPGRDRDSGGYCDGARSSGTWHRFRS